MKKIIVITFLMLPGLINAVSIETASPFPNAKKGINIMPMSEINIPSAMKKQILKNKKTLAVQEFETTTSSDENIISLFKLERSAKEEIKYFDNDKNPYDTHLKSSPSKINLAFHFNGIPKQNV